MLSLLCSASNSLRTALKIKLKFDSSILVELSVRERTLDGEEYIEFVVGSTEIACTKC